MEGKVKGKERELEREGQDREEEEGHMVVRGRRACGGIGSKGRAANGDRLVDAASCRRKQHTMASCQDPSSSVFILLHMGAEGRC